MYEVGPWFVYLMNFAILAILGLIGLIWVLKQRNKHAKEAQGKVLAEIELPTGRSLTALVRPTPDAWVKLGKLGDYRLASPRRLCECGKDEINHELKKVGTEVVRAGCPDNGCAGFKIGRTISPIRRWAKWPPNPFLGMRTLQVDVMTERWWLNNPEPQTPPENRTLVTAVDASFHTRESDAEKASQEINEQEARQKELRQALANQPNKTVVYVGLGAAVLIGVVCLIQIFALGG